MSEKLANAPVYYALAKVDFNPVAAMAKYVDEIQDQFRRRGYSLYEVQKIPQLIITNQVGDTAATPQVDMLVTWRFTKADRTSGYILNPSSIVFHTTHYETSDEFLPALLDGLSIIHGVVSLDHVARAGLRYLDAVIPEEGETVEKYLTESIHGLTIDDTSQRYSMHEEVFDTKSGPLIGNGTLLVRIYRAIAPLGYPADMVPSGLTPMSKFDVKESIAHAILDTDHFVEGQMPIDFNAIDAQLRSLHKTIKTSFNAIRTAHAKAVWSKNREKS